MVTQMIKNTLAKYGATLTDDGNIEKNGKVLNVTFRTKGARLQTKMCSQMLMSGPLAASTIERFVEDYWMWRKI